MLSSWTGLLKEKIAQALQKPHCDIYCTKAIHVYVLHLKDGIHVLKSTHSLAVLDGI